MMKLSTQDLKATLFDFDGTLVLTEAIHYQNFKAILAQRGIDLMPYEEFIRVYSGKGGQFILNDQLEKHGKIANLDELITLKKSLFKKHIELHGVELVTGAKEFLLQLQRLDIKIALVTGGYRSNFETILKYSDLPNVFDVVITNEDISEPKPSPFCYLMAAKKLHVAEPQCIVFEDAFNGIQSALNAGMPCVAIASSNTQETISTHFPQVEVIKDFTKIQLL